jgi:hypothetical protein
MQAFNVSVDRSEALRERTVRVDLVGLSDFDKTKWEAISLGAYWEPGNPDRTTARDEGFLLPWVFHTGAVESRKVLSKNDAIWGKWKARNAMHLCVMADNLPGQKRLVVPLDKSRWETQTIEIILRDRKIFLRTNPLPEQR